MLFYFSSCALFWLVLFLISSFGIKWRKFSTKLCSFLQDFVVKGCQAHAAGLSPREWPSHLTRVLFKELNQSPLKIQLCLWDIRDALRDLQGKHRGPQGLAQPFNIQGSISSSNIWKIIHFSEHSFQKSCWTVTTPLSACWSRQDQFQCCSAGFKAPLKYGTYDFFPSIL